MLTDFSIFAVLVCAACVLLGGAAVGYAGAAVFEPDRRSRLLVAPSVGLGVYGVAGTLAFRILPFSSVGILVLAVLVGMGLAVLGRRSRLALFALGERVSLVWVLVAAGLALAPALAVSPQWHDGSVGLGSVVFDHGKTALIDEIVRNGVPVHNPFYQQAGSANLVNYYFIYYLVAASAARIVGATGWEADIALTWVVGFCALSVLGWAAAGLGRRRASAWWALALAFTVSLRVIVNIFFGPDLLRGYLAREHHFESWLEQTSWVPQHSFAATLAILAALGLAGVLRQRGRAIGACVIVGALVAASYDSSIWIGGIGLATILPLIALAGFVLAQREARLSVVIAVAITALSAILLASDVLSRNVALAGQRKALALWSYPTLAPSLHAPVAVGEIAYWCVWLVADYGFAYVVCAALALAFLRRPRRPDMVELALAVTILMPLLVAQHLHSVIANNDLGWRLVLPAAYAMAIVAAANVPRLLEGTARWWTAAAAALLLVPAVAGGGVSAAVAARDAVSTESREFLARQELWRAVRAVTSNDEAVLNNPADTASMTLYPGNIAWALFGNRRSCAAGREWTAAMAPQLLPAQQDELNAKLARIFAGVATEDDLRVMAERHLCSTLVVVPEDGLWAKPLADDNAIYRLVEDRPDRWRIYRWRRPSH